MKTLTIVIPTYNMEKYLEKCLSSLVISPELMESVEVLVINDGSTDSSGSIAHSFEDKYPSTFRVIDKSNGHYGSCVNRGLAEAVGKYIKVLDADDSFDNDNFREYVRFLGEVDADMVLNNFYWVDVNGEKVRLVENRLKDRSVAPFTTRQAGRFTRNDLQMHTVAYLTENLRKIQYCQSEGVSYSDQEWVFTPLMTVKTIANFDRPLYLYLIGREGQSMSEKVRRKQMHDETVCILKKLKDWSAYPDVHPACKSFWDANIKSSLMSVYYNYLIKYGSGAEELDKFDEAVQAISSNASKLLYNCRIAGTCMYPARYWKKYHKVPRPFRRKAIAACNKIYRKSTYLLRDLSNLIDRAKLMI